MGHVDKTQTLHGEETWAWGIAWTRNKLTLALLCCCTSGVLFSWLLKANIIADTHIHTSSAMFICHLSVLYTLLYYTTIYLWTAVTHRLAPTYSTCTIEWKVCVCVWSWNTDVFTSSNQKPSVSMSTSFSVIQDVIRNKPRFSFIDSICGMLLGATEKCNLKSYVFILNNAFQCGENLYG